MRKRTPFQRSYIGLLAALFLATSGAVLFTAPQPDLPTLTLAALCALMAVALNVFIVRLETTTPGSPVYVDVTPAITIFAVLTVGHYGLLSLLVGATLARWLQQRGHQPLGYLFNAADLGVTYCVLLALAAPLRQASLTTQGPLVLTGAVVLLVVYVGLHVLYGSLLTSVGARRPVMEVVAAIYRPTAWTIGIPFTMGVFAAVLYQVAPWLLPLCILPLVLAYRALLSIAAWLEASVQLRTLNAELQETKAGLEQRVAERTAELVSANVELARIQRNREQEVTDAAHDINQVLRSAVHTLSRRPEAAPSEQELASLLAPALDVLEDMKLAARLRNDSLTLNLQPTDLVALVAQAVQHCRPRFEFAGCALSVEVLDDIPLVQCDGPRLRRVLLNLLDNALIYSCQREGARVMLAVTADETSVAVAVRDNGIGIASEDLRRIGERFFRVAEGVERPEGSGIGLACSTRIIALSGGSLQISSEGPGMGTTVSVVLPAARAVELAVGGERGQPQGFILAKRPLSSP